MSKALDVAGVVCAVICAIIELADGRYHEAVTWLIFAGVIVILDEVRKGRK